MPDATLTKVTINLTPDELAQLDQIAAAYRGNKTEALRQAIAHLARATQPGLSGEVWEAMQAAARRQLRRMLSENDLLACLDVTNGWYVTAADAHLIDQELEDAGHPVLAQRLRAELTPAGRACLTIACRQWWESAEPRPPMTAIFGQVRGPGMN